MNSFKLTGKVAVVTGGGGLLGEQHAEALASAGAHVVLADIEENKAVEAAEKIQKKFNLEMLGVKADVRELGSLDSARDKVLEKFGRADVLINNAAIDPKVKKGEPSRSFRVEEFPLDQWELEIKVGLTGAFLASRVFGSHMAANGGGVILNIASDLSVIAPDQRIYEKPGIDPERQFVKPATYPVIKSGLIGLTRYLATYWAPKNIRVNALSPGGVYQNQPEEFVQKLTRQIPMARMAGKNEYQGAVIFLCSDASSYMTGQNIVIDGGRTVW